MHAFINVKDARMRAVIDDVIPFVTLLSREDTFERHQSANPNFYFAPGQNFLQSDRIADAAVSPLYEEIQQKIRSVVVKDAICYIRDALLGDGSRLTVVIDDPASPADINTVTCLAAGLTWFREQSLDNFNADDWLRSLAKSYMMRDR